MHFDILRSIEVLSATPAALRALLGNLSHEWFLPEAAASQLSGIHNPESTIQTAVWHPYDVVGHLIHGEQTDWIPRARIILEQGPESKFVPFDRFAQFENSKGKSLTQLLDEFEKLRAENIGVLRSWNLADEQLELEATHPELGRVKLRQLLATWTVHDLNHLRQIATELARRYQTEVGPWKAYLSILKS